MLLTVPYGTDTRLVPCVAAKRRRYLQIALDESDSVPFVDPNLVVVTQATYELGRTAADLLRNRIEDGTRFSTKSYSSLPSSIVSPTCTTTSGEFSESGRGG